MTFIAVFQGKKCALVASDLMHKFSSSDQLQLPYEKRNIITLVSDKFRRNVVGDYLAFNGRLNTQEYAALCSKSLEELTAVGLKHDEGFRKDYPLTAFYASIHDAQLYAADLYHDPLIPFERGRASASCGTSYQYPQELMDLTRRIRSGTRIFDKDFLERLSAEYEKYFIGHENGTDDFGGYVAHIITPRKMRIHSRNLGKLEGCEEAQFLPNGEVYF